MESTCNRLLDHCVDGTPWSSSLIDEITWGIEKPEGCRTFFRIVVEKLSDLFEPRLCIAYVRIMSGIFNDPWIETRYREIREPRRVKGDPKCVYVLSRITLGADVAVTSVFLDAAKRRFPKARILLAGPRKNWEMFAADPRIGHFDCPYARSGSIADRVEAAPEIDDPDAIVLDPDSRLSQLGVLQVVRDDGRYFFFESRAYKPESHAALPELASQWCEETLGVPGNAYVAPRPASTAKALCTVNLGVGENPAKRVADPFEAELLRGLPDDTLIDLGGSKAEADRVRHAAGKSKRMFQGGFADFAWLISQSKLYVGYDSAGMHVAAACGVPMVCVFAGEVCEKFYQRWRPVGPGPIEVVRASGNDVLAKTKDAISRLGR